jgi:hypothetical protein
MKVAQLVLTKTKSGKWQITVMSLTQTEVMHEGTRDEAVLTLIESYMNEEWEHLSLGA